jgi:hypothetical protein
MAEMNTGSQYFEQALNKMYGNQQRANSPFPGMFSGANNIGAQNGLTTSYWSSIIGGNDYEANSADKPLSQFDNQINKIYDANLESQKQTLKSGYDTDVSNLDAEKIAAQKETDTNLNRTYVEAAKKAKNYNEVQNAYGLTSGAMGQARLASGNQLAGDLTGIRNQGAEAQAEIERQRSILAKEYAAAIAKAQADNDMQRAQLLYEAAQKEQDRLLQVYLTKMQIEANKPTYGGGGGGGYGYGYGSGSDPDSGREPTLIERANAAAAAEKDMTKWLTDEADGGYLAGGNLTDYLAIYT